MCGWWRVLWVFLLPVGWVLAAPADAAFVRDGRAPVHLKASNGRYVAAEIGGDLQLRANRDKAADWETFWIVRRSPHVSSDLTVSLRADNGKYVSADADLAGKLVANRDTIGPWERFTLVPLEGDTFALRAHDGRWVSADQTQGGALVADRTERGPWETFSADRVVKDLFNRRLLPTDARRMVKAQGTWCLDVKGASTAAGTPLIVWGCRYDTSVSTSVAIPVPHQYLVFNDAILPDGRRITSERVSTVGTPGMCLTNNGRGKTVTLEPCLADGGDTRQLWATYMWDRSRIPALEPVDKDLMGFLDTFIKGVEWAGGQPVDYYQIRSQEGLCLDVLGGEVAAGKELGLWECKSFGLNQTFTVSVN